MAGLLGARAEETGGTGGNPALKYYQAYLLSPPAGDSDRDYLFTNDWRGQKLTVRFGELMSGYDKVFRLVRMAAHDKEACDWGIDWSAGPETLLPQLARNKGIAQAAKLRAMWHLQNGREADAVEDLMAAFVLGRHCSDDHTLISVLVQIAIENIICSAIAENFHEFSPESLKQLAAGIEAAPARGTVSAAILSERVIFHDWFLKKIQKLQQDHPGDEKKVLAGVRVLLANMNDAPEGSTNGPTDFAGRAISAGGGTSAGLVKLLHDERLVYNKIGEVMALPKAEFEAQMPVLMQSFPNPRSPFAPEAIPAFVKSRTKEFGIQATLAMVRAAIGYKLSGEAGLQSVADPFGNGPFSFSRAVLAGVDRGFMLRSEFSGRGYPEVLIFLENSGPVINVAGAHAGEAPAQK